jgi:hypothetical protein
METRIHDLQIAPRIDDIARRIELDERRSQSCRVEISLVHVLAIQNQDVILRVDADSTKAAECPAIRQWLWPGEVSLVLDRARLRVHVRADLKVGPYHNREDDGRGGDNKRSNLRVHWSVPFSSR